MFHLRINFRVVKHQVGVILKYFLLLVFVSGCAAQSTAPPAKSGVKQVIAGLRSQNPRDLYRLLPKRVRKQTSFQVFAARWNENRIERHHQAESLAKAVSQSPEMTEWASIARGKVGTIHLRRKGGAWKLESALATHEVALRPIAAVKYFATALGRRDFVALLRVLTKSRRQEIRTRVESFSQSLSKRIASGDLVIGPIGDSRAEAHWEDDDYRYRLLLQKEGDQWRIQDFDLRAKPPSR